MAPPTTIQADDAPTRHGAPAGALRGVLRVLPVCAASALFAHLAWYGLRPALAERARLDAVERDVVARHAELRAVERELQTTDAALDDEVYRERLRRNFRRDHALELEQARAGATPERLADPTWFGRPGELEALTRGAVSERPGAPDGLRPPGSGTDGDRARRSRVR